jgi:ribosome-binding protein aMBF1 (putative translation factor)
MAKKSSTKVVRGRKSAYPSAIAAGGASKVSEKGADDLHESAKRWRTLDPNEPGISNAERILRSMIGDAPDVVSKYEVAQINYEIAQMIYDAREAAGMTQAQLAAAIGTTQSVISRLEDADYNGHSLQMLRRVAKATGRRVEIRFVPLGRKN